MAHLPTCLTPTWLTCLPVLHLHGLSAYLSYTYMAHLPTCLTPAWHTCLPVLHLHGLSAYLSYTYMAHLPTCLTSTWHTCLPVLHLHGLSAYLSYTYMLICLPVLHLHGSPAYLSYTYMAHLPACLYCSVFVQKSTGSVDVHTYFSKYGQRVSRQYGSCDVNASSLPVKSIIES